jgi:transposase
LDNASIHHDDEVVQLIESVGARVLFTAPYSPELNPIEYMSRKYKAMLKRFHCDHWFNAHMKALMSVTPADAKSWYQHCRVPGCEHFPRSRAVDAQDRADEETLAMVAATTVVTVLTVATLAGKRKR